MEKQAYGEIIDSKSGREHEGGYWRDWMDGDNFVFCGYMDSEGATTECNWARADGTEPDHDLSDLIKLKLNNVLDVANGRAGTHELKYTIDPEYRSADHWGQAFRDSTGSGVFLVGWPASLEAACIATRAEEERARERHAKTHCRKHALDEISILQERVGRSRDVYRAMSPAASYHDYA